MYFYKHPEDNIITKSSSLAPVPVKGSFFSMVCGKFPLAALDPSKNPPQHMYGLLARYPAHKKDALEHGLFKDITKPFEPTWLIQAPGEYVYMIWEFEKPVQVFHELLKLIYFKIQPTKWLSHFDVASYMNPCTYLPAPSDEVDRRKLGDVIPADFLNMWTEEAEKEAEEVDTNTTVGRHVVYDGSKFWNRDEETGAWLPMSSGDFLELLKYLDKIPNAKAIAASLKITHRVKTAAPFIFMPKGIIKQGLYRYLNTATVRPITPTPPWTTNPITWLQLADFCPNIYQLIRSLFTLSQEHRDHILAWLKESYTHSLSFEQGGLGDPTPGIPLMLLGPAHQGKAVFVGNVLAPLLGSVSQGERFLLEREQYNSRRWDCPLDINEIKVKPLDRDVPGYLAKVLQDLLKDDKRPAYAKDPNVVWYGRRVVICDTATACWNMAPSLPVSRDTQALVLYVYDRRPDLFIHPDLEDLARELPFFGRFLLEMPYPKNTLDRYGKLTGLIESAPEVTVKLATGRAEYAAMLLKKLVADQKEKHEDRIWWQGTVDRLRAELYEIDRSQTKRFMVSNKSLGVMMARLRDKYGFNITRHMSRTKTVIKAVWRIAFDLTGPVDSYLLAFDSPNSRAVYEKYLKGEDICKDYFVQDAE